MRTTTLSLICLFFALCSGQDPSIPVPGVGEWWQERHESFVANTEANPSIPIIFYGDSITEYWAWRGLPVFNRYYAQHNVTNYGISGDHTQHVLFRIQNGEVAGLNPRLIVLQIGTNNIASATVPDIAEGILTIIETLQSLLPSTRILLVSILPRNGLIYFDSISEINSIIAQYHNGQNVFFLNIFSAFTGAVWGTVNGNLFVDGWHLNEAGYQRWAELMNPLFNQLIQ